MPADRDVTFLLPAAARLGRQRLSAGTLRILARGDRLDAGDSGRRAQLLRHLPLPGDGWPIAALSRQAGMGDAGDHAWLRADPVWMRPDINGVRLMAHGQALQLSPEEGGVLVEALRPLFGDAGFELDAPDPARWYLRLPADTRLPASSDPGDALGEDVFEHMDTSPEGRAWRTLASESQVILHNHPLNEARAARGRSPVNALWFWGGGRLPPGAPSSRVDAFSDDDTARALAGAGGAAADLPDRFAGVPGLYDLEGTRDLQWIEQAWLAPALAALKAGRIARLVLDDAAGWRMEIRRWHALRFWRSDAGWPAP